jgi:hypothetical protein
MKTGTPHREGDLDGFGAADRKRRASAATIASVMN